MKRRTLDLLLTWTGALLTVALIGAGSLLLWGYNFANSQVKTQLAQQQIFFPAKSAFTNAKVGTEITPSMIPSVSQYAGQQMLTGAQAEVYANDFIAVHLKEIGNDLTYSQLSAKAQADPSNTALAAQVETVFKGTMLRGSLLNAYGYWTFGQIAMYAAIGAFVVALLMLLLTILGLRHYRRVDDTTVV
jgi:spore germination protein GerM